MLLLLQMVLDQVCALHRRVEGGVVVLVEWIQIRTDGAGEQLRIWWSR